MRKPKKIGNTLVPRNLVYKDMMENSLYKPRTIPPKKGKKSNYKRSRIDKRNIDTASFLCLYYL